MSITIHPELEARLRARADAEGLNSGEPIATDEKYWQQKRARLTERNRNTDGRCGAGFRACKPAFERA